MKKVEMYSSVNRFIGGATAIALLILPVFSQSTFAGTGSKCGFIENKGQISDQEYQPNSAVRFLYSGKNLKVQLRKQGFSYELFRIIQSPDIEKIIASSSPDLKKLRELKLQSKTETHRIDVELPGSNPDAEIIADEAFPDYLNYYTPAVMPNGALRVRHFRKITYHNIYPQVDLIFEINKNSDEVKYDFIVKPGGNAKDIHLLYKGGGEINFSEDKITVQTSISPLTETIPAAYQERGERKIPIKVSFYKIGENEFGFTSEKYDPAIPLVIDPVPAVAWGTYYGGSGSDYGMGAAIDVNGNVLASGDAQSAANIATAGAFQTVYAGLGDIFIVKFDTAGNRLWATYYGGSGWDASTCITADGSGNIFVTGWVTGPTVFSTPGAHQVGYGGGPWDAVIAKFDPNGVRIWSTYYGGTGDDEGWGIVTDASGNVMVTGNTQSTTNIASPGAHQGIYGGGPNDAFIAKFNPGGTLLWGTYYGGTGNETYYYRSGLVVDNNGNVINTSWTSSPNAANVIATAGAYQTNLNGLRDGYIVKFDPNGTRLWSTYYGGVNDDSAYGAVTDANGNIIMVGETSSPANIASAGAYQTTLNGTTDAFIAKFDQTGSFQWGSYFGGAGVDRAFAVENSCTNLVFFGLTGSSSGIATANTHQTTYGGGTNDGFITLFSPNGNSVVWSTYYGGNNDEYAYFSVIGMASNPANDVAIVGSTSSTNNIAYGNAHQSALNTAYDVFVARFAGAMIQLTASDTVICAGQNSTLTASGGTSYSWNTGDTTSSIIASPTSTTTYTVAVSNGVCAQSATITVNVNGINPVISGNTTICSGVSTTLSASGGTSYSWSTGATTAAAAVAPAVTTTYTVVASNSNGCTATATATVFVSPPPVAATSGNVSICPGETATLSASGGTNYSWSTGDTTTAVAVAPAAGTTYTVVVTNGNCSTTATVSVIVNPLPAATAGTTATINIGGSTTLTAAGGGIYSWTPSTGLNCAQCPDPVASPSVTTEYCVYVTDAAGCMNSACVRVTVDINCNVYLPNAFSPNNDGENDMLYVYGNCISEMTFIIYNRFGEKVFEYSGAAMKSEQGWDGYFKGKLEDSAVFTCYMGYTLLAGGSGNKKGNISLIR